MSEVLKLRLVVTTDEFEKALDFYRDTLGLREEAISSTPDGCVALLAAGRATLEISDRRNAEFIDQVEVGRRVAGPIRVAFQVTDTEAATRRLESAGATVLGEPRATPFNSVNSRLEAPAGLQLTLFQHDQANPETW